MMSLRRSTTTSLLCALVLWAPVHVRAQAGDAPAAEASDATESARLHFRNAVDLYRERNFRAALIEFKHAYKAAPHYKLLYNLGQASLELQEDVPAIEYFQGYLREGAAELSDERKREVEQEIVRLRARLAHVTVEVNQAGAEILVDDSVVGTAPLTAPVLVSVGRRRVVATKHGYSAAERTVDVAAGEQLQIALELRERDPGLASLQRQLAELPKPQVDSALSPAAWSGIATGVLAAGAITLTVLTGIAQQDYDDERSQRTTLTALARVRNDAETKALAADITWGASIAAAGLTALLWALDGADSPAREGRDGKRKDGVQVELGAGAVRLRSQF